MMSPFDPFGLWQAWFEACARIQQSALRSMQGVQGPQAFPLGIWSPFAPAASLTPLGGLPFGQPPFLAWAAPFWAAQSPWGWMPTTIAAMMTWPFGTYGQMAPAGPGIGAAFKLAEDAFGMAAQAKIPAALDPWGLMRVSFGAWGQLANRSF